jgi:hypothetical protein
MGQKVSIRVDEEVFFDILLPDSPKRVGMRLYFVTSPREGGFQEAESRMDLIPNDLRKENLLMWCFQTLRHAQRSGIGHNLLVFTS